MRPALVGLALGLAGALGLTRLLASQLYEISPTDPSTLITAALALAAVAFLACWLPAHRATRMDPMKALRFE
jgi:putative ABC transport system permease protein